MVCCTLLQKVQFKLFSRVILLGQRAILKIKGAVQLGMVGITGQAGGHPP